MEQHVLFKNSQKPFKTYYEDIARLTKAGVSNEMAVRAAFQTLLTECAKKRKWLFAAEQTLKSHGQQIRPDGTLYDDFNLPRGYWEAKDTHDDLDKEISGKLKSGYPTVNTIFEDSKTAVLFQNGEENHRFDLSNPDELIELLNTFFTHDEPAIDNFERAVDEFKTKVPDIAKGLAEKIKTAHDSDKNFQRMFDGFFDLCKNSLNPNISRDAVDEMLIQHLLTERLFTTVFNNPDFIRKNAIASEIAKVIDALVRKSFSKKEFEKSLDRFYIAIEDTARNITDFTDKQHFLNTVYERFFQGYSVKVADTHGIVYTPQPIVDFMCASVEEVLKEEFGLTLGSSEVNILDPCTGTGNFIVNLMRKIHPRDLPNMYREHLFANEVMLLPYYISALNIEHAYYEIMGEYEPFEGLCFVDTLDLAKGRQTLLSFSEDNTKRLEREAKTPITVILGNPPYNAWQVNENDNNKNRTYSIIDAKIKETYAKDSHATNKNALSDMYVKFFRWATDRLNGRDGIVSFVSNNGFLRGISFDGFRMHLENEFTSIYHFDLKGNARTSGERRRKEGGNIFEDKIRVGIGITVLVRNSKRKKNELFYHEVPDYLRSEQKKQYLRELSVKSLVRWNDLKPDERHSWLVPANVRSFMSFIPLGTKEAKREIIDSARSVFHIYSNGVKTNRDEIVFDFNRDKLLNRIQKIIDDYNSEVDRYVRKCRNIDNEALKRINIHDFVKYDSINWSMGLKISLQNKLYAECADVKVRAALYRPFVKRILFFDRVLNEAIYKLENILPTVNNEKKNRIICASSVGSTKSFSCIITRIIPDYHLTGDTQCFPYYTYDEDGSNQQENITDWALERYREQYKNKKITKWDIFYYIYGVLHHPGYREKYGDNLKRDLPRIPFAPDFWAFSKAGKELAKWHLEYESVTPYNLGFDVAKDKPLSYKVEDKMRLSKDKTELKVNQSLTLTGIPPETFEYRLGNRSALEWVIEYYVVKTFPRSGIKSDCNNYDDEEYIVRLVAQVVSVSLETVKLVKSLPADFGG